MRSLFFLALALVLVAFSSAASAPQPLRLRGGGILSSLANSLSWHRSLQSPLYTSPVFSCLAISGAVNQCCFKRELNWPTLEPSQYCFGQWGVGTNLEEPANLTPLFCRHTVGPSQLGCGPLPQVKDDNRHTENVKSNQKKHDGSGMTRSHSFTIPDIANQR